jgi:cold shock CspA family protein
MLAGANTAQAVVATGGNVVTYTENTTNFTAHIFTNSENATLTTNIAILVAGPVEYLVVAGGGGGGAQHGGGGGAGGFLTGVTNVTAGVPAGMFTIIVGQGGAAADDNIAGYPGSNSVFGTITAFGGGGGRSYNTGAADHGGGGGSGGGGAAWTNTAGGPATNNQGYAGGLASGANASGGGGGGAGETGDPATTGGGNGGDGVQSAVGAAAGQQLGAPAVDVVRRFLFGSYAANHDPRDQDAGRRQQDFFAMLRERYHYEVEVFPLDFKGRRLRRADRAADVCFEPRERGVDIALASCLMYYAAVPRAYDVALVVLGDHDFVPLLQQVRRLGKRVVLASIRTACCAEFADAQDRAGVRDAAPLWLEDMVEQIALQYVRHELPCESPLHAGERRVWTTFAPRKGERFYCDACRAAYARERALAAEVNGRAAPGQVCGGGVKILFPDRGFGFLRGDDGADYFFHATDLEDGLVFEDLQEGLAVEFEVRQASLAGKAGAAQRVRPGGGTPPALPAVSTRPATS